MAEKKTGFQPKIIKHVTLPTLKVQPGVPIYVRIEEKMFEGKSQPAKDGKEARKAPMLFNVTNLETGEPMQLVANTVVQREIVDNYEKDSYVGKCFMIEKGEQKGTGDRKYFTFNIAEIADPAK